MLNGGVADLVDLVDTPSEGGQDDQEADRGDDQAQHVAAVMAHALGVRARSPKPGTLADKRLDDAVQQLRSASTPLLQVLDPETQAAIRGGDSA